jgi:uncharacterized protein (TIGR02246 family)
LSTSSAARDTPGTIANDEEAAMDEVRALYHQVLDAWNRRSARDFAALFADDGEVIGFDGSENKTRAKIAEELERIFADHETGRYVGKVRSVRPLGSDRALVRAVGGLVPAGATDLNPELNAVQSVVAERRDDGWRIVLYQNTPAQFHGRPELVERLTQELREELR